MLLSLNILIFPCINIPSRRSTNFALSVPFALVRLTEFAKCHNDFILIFANNAY